MTKKDQYTRQSVPIAENLLTSTINNQKKRKTMYNEKKVTIKPDRTKLMEVFEDKKKENNDHITVTVREDKDHFLLALWGAWKLADQNSFDASSAGNLVTQFQELDVRLAKLIGFAELAKYATGFEIPEDHTFYGFNINDLGEVTND